MSKFRVAILLNRTLLSHVASPLAIREDIVFMGLFLTISPPGNVLQGQRRPKEKGNVFDVYLRILLKQNTALLSYVCVLVTGVTSQVFSN